MTPQDLNNLCTQLNGDRPIDSDLLNQLLTQGKTVLEGERDWMNLRGRNTSVSVQQTSITGWNVAISIAGISDFLRFYWDEARHSFPFYLFDGQNRIERYTQVPLSRQLEYKDVNNTFCHDPIAKVIYINGITSFPGTLYINYIKNTGDIDVLHDTTDIETSGIFPFPKRFHPVLAYYAVGINKGAIDYDDIVKLMLPSNTAALQAMKGSMENFDTNLQLNEQMNTDPSGGDMPLYRSMAINPGPNRPF